MLCLSVPSDARHEKFAVAKQRSSTTLILQGGQLPPHDVTLAFVLKRKLDCRAHRFACCRAVNGFFADQFDFSIDSFTVKTPVDSCEERRFARAVDAVN